jgi:gliding motility-associated protein GldE
MTINSVSTLADPLVTTLHSSFFGDNISIIVIIAILLICSGIISGSEAAFFSLSPAEKNDLKQDDSKKARLTHKLLSKPQDLLATMLVTNNFVNVGIVILSSSVVHSAIPDKGDETLRFIVEVIGITFTLLLIGEVIPKIYATKNALFFAKQTSGILNFLRSAPPVSWIRAFLLNGSNFINKRAKKKGVKISSDELEQALALTREENSHDGEHKILEGIVKFGNTDVKQIMQSRMEVVGIEKNTEYKKVLEKIVESGYSRIPVYDNSFDNVIGILYIKDILPFLNHTEKDIKWLELIRKPFFVPENKKIDDLLKEFQVKKMHMAVVVDEYGGAEGIVTLEDILEEIVGDITDEFDVDEIIFTKIDDCTFRIEGRTSLVDLYKVLDVDGKEFEASKGEAETLGGFIVENAGRILKNKESIFVGETKLTVESSDKRRIKMVKVTLPKPEIT